MKLETVLYVVAAGAAVAALVMLARRQSAGPVATMPAPAADPAADQDEAQRLARERLANELRGMPDFWI